MKFRRNQRRNFPTVRQLQKVKRKRECVCGKDITVWHYDDGWRWVHIHNARRNHSRDIVSPEFFLTGIAYPKD